MKTTVSQRNYTYYFIWAISAVFWAILFWNSWKNGIMTHSFAGFCSEKELDLTMIGSGNILYNMMMGWMVMVLAMMLPKLIVPIQIIVDQSFKHMRLGLVLLFVIGYGVIWTLFGLLATIVCLLLNFYFSESYLLAIVVGGIAILWQFSPTKQKCLNKGHYHPVLSAWGFKAYRDAFVFGILHGCWCVGSGWVLMMLPMVLPQGHYIAMLLISLMMFSEHLEHPQSPRWRIDFRLKIIRILFS